ncbi:MAG: SPL family radical SAM protein [Faecousia sp.]
MHYVKAKGILSADNGMNLYRGCLHGCIYCDSRSLCYQMDHVFEDIEVKENALELLEQALKRKRKPCMIGTGAMTDPYLPLEEKLCLTRGALELIRRYGFGATVLTKSDAILRDLDLLADINRQAKAVVQMTLTTYDDRLCRILEPRVCVTSQRIAALKAFRDAGVPTIVWLDPILPFLNDTRENIDGILDACIDAGVKGVLCFNMGLTLRSGNREYFYAQLDRHFPGLKERYIRTYGNQYEINSPRNAELMALFHRRCEQSGMLHDVGAIFRYLHEFPEEEQSGQISFLPGSM